MVSKPVTHARLRDGTLATIRPYVEADRASLVDFVAALSGESRRLRFHSAGMRVDPDALLGGSDARQFVALIAGELAGVACYVPLTDPAAAELAVAVRDDEQGRGVGMRLVEQLAGAARREGFGELVAEVLGDNRPMLGLLSELGFREQRRAGRGEVEVRIDLRDDEGYEQARERRDHGSAVASLRPLLEPRSVAVIGASRRAGSVGHAVLQNLLTGGFPGPVYPINPNADSVAGVAAYPSVGAVGRPVDAAVVCVPAPLVLDTARDCAEHGVGGLVVVSAGFGEESEAGRVRQDQLLALCRDRHIRLLGPNCLGLLVNRPGFVLDATFAATRPPFGNVAIASQSGALGIAVLEGAGARGLGVSLFASTGNKADISSNDLLEAFEEDPATGVVALYLESFGNPRRFGRIARRVAARKPIVAVKSGRSAAGRRAAASHTGALASSDAVTDALFRQAGVLRTDTLAELFDTVQLLAQQPLPAGNRVGIVTNAGGLGILCADACAGTGLELPELHGPTIERVRELLGPGFGANPLDTLAAAAPEIFAQAVRTVRQDPAVDACIALYAPTKVVRGAAVAAALAEDLEAQPSDKPLLACILGAPDRAVSGSGARSFVPGATTFAFPESAVRALGHAAALTAFRRRPRGARPALSDADVRVARRACRGALGDRDSAWLSADEVSAVLGALRIRTLETRFASSEDEAAAAFVALGGGPVAVKLVAEGVLHKSDVGGVRLGVTNAAAVREAFAAIRDALERHGDGAGMRGVLLQPMAPAGIECLAGVAADPTFGPVVAFGAGGVLAELIGAASLRITPLTDRDAAELVDGSPIKRLLDGYRGAPAGDVDALRDVVLRVSRLAEEVVEVAELDLNPVVALPPGQGAVVLDARIRVSRP